jgi:hypothetical protein
MGGGFDGGFGGGGGGGDEVVHVRLGLELSSPLTRYSRL